MRIALATPDEWDSPPEALSSSERMTFAPWLESPRGSRRPSRAPWQEPDQPVPPRNAQLTSWVPRTPVSGTAWQQLLSKIEVLAVLPPAPPIAPRPQAERLKVTIGDGQWFYLRILPKMEVHRCC